MPLRDLPPLGEPLTPDQAIARLVAGNKRFALDKLIYCYQTIERREETFDGQRPFAVVLGCSDSRVPPEVIFDQRIGDIFTIRVAGNIAGILEQESIEYSILYNGSSVILVLGHENCGAIRAVLTENTKDIPSIASMIEPTIKKINPKLELISPEEAAKASVINTVQQLRTNPIFKPAVDQNKLKIVGGYYNLATGIVEILPI